MYRIEEVQAQGSHETAMRKEINMAKQNDYRNASGMRGLSLYQ